jgi:endonuclease-3
MTPAAIEQFFARLAAANPHPVTELHYTSPFTLLVAVVLSAQATDVGVNKATGPLFAVADTPEKMLALGEDGLKTYLRSLNFYNAKARNIIKLCAILVEQYHSNIPTTREELEQLPGVGRKTANVVLNVAFGAPTIAVDTHIFRVSNRTGLAPGKDPLAVELKLEAVVPEHWRLHAHHWLILHGRYICKARQPQCTVCPVNDLCAYYRQLQA